MCLFSVSSAFRVNLNVFFFTDYNCANRPVFSPSRLVVKHGDPTSATCSLCPSCPDGIFDVEKSVGSNVKNGRTITWTVEKMMEWKTTPKCFYTTKNNIQCCTRLNITLYSKFTSICKIYTLSLSLSIHPSIHPSICLSPQRLQIWSPSAF